MARELHDGFGRGINYLRISVTDKCNFRCVYCMPEKGVPARAHGELLTAEEIARFVRIVAQEGITRVRLTADGTIRPCLFSDAEYPVREALRSGDEDTVRAIYRNAIARKPRQHDDIDGTQRFMSQIGG